ncbi:hypothetical protein DPX16_9987 [Anabarilius grahami]|uniref:Uncharacterized protein n=1 Tax=Anabarilius grahami TaxID=495550 RepID=A0A3N0XWP4_ANAGA|nr:hypothetical protein DPX16_9987 [Anabarilius grahami]
MRAPAFSKTEALPAAPLPTMKSPELGTQWGTRASDTNWRARDRLQLYESKRHAEGTIQLQAIESSRLALQQRRICGALHT